MHLDKLHLVYLTIHRNENMSWFGRMCSQYFAILHVYFIDYDTVSARWTWPLAYSDPNTHLWQRRRPDCQISPLQNSSSLISFEPSLHLHLPKFWNPSSRRILSIQIGRTTYIVLRSRSAYLCALWGQETVSDPSMRDQTWGRVSLRGQRREVYGGGPRMFDNQLDQR